MRLIQLFMVSQAVAYCERPSSSLCIIWFCESCVLSSVFNYFLFRYPPGIMVSLDCGTVHVSRGNRHVPLLYKNSKRKYMLHWYLNDVTVLTTRYFQCVDALKI